jgi:hypothetical protein
MTEIQLGLTYLCLLVVKTILSGLDICTNYEKISLFKQSQVQLTFGEDSH